MEVDFTFLDGGYCTHPERMTIRSGRWKSVQYPSMFVLIAHPVRGYILYDTGYSEHFHTETARFPHKIYAMITPVFIERGDSAVDKLRAMGIGRDEISYIIISHFHADHIAGLRDFPKAKLISFRSAFDAVRHYKGLRATFAGYIENLLPADFLERSLFVEDHARGDLVHPISSQFSGLYDLFGDGSLVAMELPGHARGQLGLYLRARGGRELFLVADTCWLSRAFRNNEQPSRITRILVDDPVAYRSTLQSLGHIHRACPDLIIAPSHCGEIFAQHVTSCRWDPGRMNGLPWGAVARISGGEV